MFNILFFGLDEKINALLLGLVNGVFSIVMWIYEILMELALNPDSFFEITFINFSETLYIIAGIFMVFRVIVGLLQMLVNPDQINDKQVGASKMLSRIIVVIILLLVCDPQTGLLFGNGRLLDRLESAILSSDSILYKITGYKTDNMSGGNIGNLMVDDVYAANDWSKTCYFYKPILKVPGGPNNPTRVLGEPAKYLKVVFSNNPSGAISVTNSEDIYMKIIVEETDDFSFTNPGITSIKINDSVSKISNCSNWSIEKGWITGWKLNHKEASVEGYKGLNSLDEFKQESNEDIQKNKEAGVTLCDENYHCSDIDSLFELPSAKALAFGRTTVGSFERCAKDSELCNSGKEAQFTVEGNEQLVKAMTKNEMELDWLIAIIGGLILVFILGILCIDVIVRQFKLFLLEMMAPIPIISYADPKDKVFNQWVKMYVNIYLDLFIKLLAIMLATYLLGSLKIKSGIGLVSFFIIIAILIFAKAIPTMISDIFGLKLNSSFKDIAGMAKAGAGLAAGAAIGGAVGLATGKGFGRVTGALGGALRGAGAGSKGKVLGGAQSISASNARTNQMKADGLKFMDRLAIGVAGATGIPLAGKKAEEQMKLADAVLSKRKDLDNWAADDLKKKGAEFSSKGVESTYIDANGNEQQLTGYITSKNKKKIVTKADEKIDMQQEYVRQQSLNSITIEQWNSMSQLQRMAEFGDLVGSQKSYTDATMFMNDRIAALEDYGKAERINVALDKKDEEVIKIVGSVNDAISDAQIGGLDIKEIPTESKFNNETLKNVKDQSNREYNKVGKENADSLKKQKYINNK